jgi:hypothetical protein
MDSPGPTTLFAACAEPSDYTELTAMSATNMPSRHTVSRRGKPLMNFKEISMHVSFRVGCILWIAAGNAL